RNEGNIMINSDNQEVKVLQREIGDSLSGYKNYVVEETRSYEENFNPHITIATNLNKEEFESAKNDLRDNFNVHAKLNKVILTVIYDFKGKTEKRENTVWSLS